VFPHSTAQLVVQQYRERSPTPLLGMKGRSEAAKKLYDNELSILAGTLIGS
jgi:hypothetical protein